MYRLIALNIKSWIRPHPNRTEMLFLILELEIVGSKNCQQGIPWEEKAWVQGGRPSHWGSRVSPPSNSFPRRGVQRAAFHQPAV